MARKKIGVFSDTHVGYNGNASLHNEFGELRTEKTTSDGSNTNIRTYDVNKAYEESIDIFIEENVDAVFHGGDGMNFWGYKYPSISNFYMEQVHRLSEIGIPYVEIVGNHNFAKKAGVGCELFKLDLLSGVKTIYEGYYTKYNVPGTNIVVHGVPSTTTKEKFDQQMDLAERKDGKFNLLLTHCGITDIEYYANSDGIVTHLDTLIQKNMDLTIVGDFHKFVDFGNNIYSPGATERFSFGEVNEKPRVLIFEIDDETGEIFNMTPRYLNVRPMLDIEPIDAKGKKLADIQKEIVDSLNNHPIEDAIVRLRVENLPKSLKHRHLFLTEEMIALQKKCLIFKFDLKNKVELTEAIKTNSDIEFESVMTRFETFVKNLPKHPDVDNEVLYNEGMKYLKEALENEAS